MSQPIVHSERHGDFGPVYTLTPESLVMESKAPLGSLRKAIPVASIVGFYTVVYQFQGALTGRDMGRSEQFLLAWREGERINRETWIVNVAAPSFRTLLEALARLRPDASLLGLPSQEAHRRLGMTSMARTAMIVAGVIIVVVLLVVIAVIALVVG
ncbi:Hypothetical protein A7982_05757 [Minicystis rosea]|nr:Hypothetical protein A7982_05757 [Minicystis rosea]